MALGGVFFITGGGLLADIHWRGPFFIYGASLLLFPLIAIYLFEPTIKKEKRNASTIDSTFPKHTVIMVYITVFISMLIFYVVPVQVPYLLKELNVKSNAMVGLAITAATLFAALASMNYRRIRSLLSFSQVYTAAFLVVAIGYTVIYYATSYAQVVAGLGLSIIDGMTTGVFIVNFFPRWQPSRLLVPAR